MIALIGVFILASVIVCMTFADYYGNFNWVFA